MSTLKISNVPLRKFRKFLSHQGLELVGSTKGRGGHEKWTADFLDRPVTIQTHVDPVPQHIVQQVLRYLDISKEDFWDIVDQI